MNYIRPCKNPLKALAFILLIMILSCHKNESIPVSQISKTRPWKGLHYTASYAIVNGQSGIKKDSAVVDGTFTITIFKGRSIIFDLSSATSLNYIDTLGYYESESDSSKHIVCFRGDKTVMGKNYYYNKSSVIYYQYLADSFWYSNLTDQPNPFYDSVGMYTK